MRACICSKNRNCGTAEGNERPADIPLSNTLSKQWLRNEEDHDWLQRRKQHCRRYARMLQGKKEQHVVDAKQRTWQRRALEHRTRRRNPKGRTNHPLHECGHNNADRRRHNGEGRDLLGQRWSETPGNHHQKQTGRAKPRIYCPTTRRGQCRCWISGKLSGKLRCNGVYVTAPRYSDRTASTAFVKMS
jgi:hypothetical protein